MTITAQNKYTTVDAKFPQSDKTYLYKVELPVQVGDTLNVSVGRIGKPAQVTVVSVHEIPKLDVPYEIKWGSVVKNSALVSVSSAVPQTGELCKELKYKGLEC